MTQEALARRLLESARTIAVVGASRHRGKAAHRIPADLAASGYEVIPVNPTPPSDTTVPDELFGTPVVPRLAAISQPIDIVNVFRPPRECPAVAREAVAIGAGALWLQLGITSPGARAIAEDAGLSYVEDLCSGLERRRWGLLGPLAVG